MLSRHFLLNLCLGALLSQELQQDEILLRVRVRVPQKLLQLLDVDHLGHLSVQLALLLYHLLVRDIFIFILLIQLFQVEIEVEVVEVLEAEVPVVELLFLLEGLVGDVVKLL